MSGMFKGIGGAFSKLSALAGGAGTVLRFLDYLAKILVASPREERRDELSKLDSALKAAREKDDTGELEKWVGRKL